MPFFKAETASVTVAAPEIMMEIALAIVVDEFGGTAGMVTSDQLVAEVVGRITDELTDDEDAIHTIDEKTSEIDAQMRIGEANEELNIHLPESDNYETVAGWILFALKRIPKKAIN